MNGLKPIADKTELKKQVELEYSYSETSFTATSWQAYQVVLQQAKAVLNNGDAEQQQVDDAVAALKEARSQLVVKYLSRRSVRQKP
jgi:predicted Zn-dependent protease